MNNLNITINPFRGEPITVSWSNRESFRKWTALQRTKSKWLNDKPYEVFANDFINYLKRIWHIREDLGAFSLPENPRILDVGCGIGTIDLFLYQYLNNPDIFLVDEDAHTTLDSNDLKRIYYSTDHPFYNSWEPLVDAIKTTGLNKNKFHLLNTKTDWPDDLDFIMSNFSWCWHYPVEVYMDKVIKSLKNTGKLLLTVRLTDEFDTVSYISELLNSTPIRIHFLNMDAVPVQRNLIEYSNPDINHALCLWTRNNNAT